MEIFIPFLEKLCGVIFIGELCRDSYCLGHFSHRNCRTNHFQTMFLMWIYQHQISFPTISNMAIFGHFIFFPPLWKWRHFRYSTKKVPSEAMFLYFYLSVFSSRDTNNQRETSLFSLLRWPGTYMHNTHNMNRALMWDFEANENETIPSYVTHVDSYVIIRRLITFPQLGSWISYGETGNRTPVSAVKVRNSIHWATRPQLRFMNISIP